MIESLSNSKIKYAIKLKQKKYRNQFNQFLVEGKHLVEEAIKSNMVSIIFTTQEETFADIENYLVTIPVMSKLSKLNNDYEIVAICNRPSYDSLSNKILLLDGVQDPGNMGTLIRTAAAFGFETIISESSVDYFNEKVIRSSQGAVFYVNLMEGNIKEFIQNHVEYHIYGTDVLTGLDIRTASFDHSKIAIILGNEGNGVRASIRDLVHTNIHIPMLSTESLNVGIAGGILMYEACKENIK